VDVCIVRSEVVRQFVDPCNSKLFPLRECADSYVSDMSVSLMLGFNHLSQIRSFLSAVTSSGFTLKLTKFALPEVTFLWHVTGSGRPDQEQVRAVECLQTHKTKSDPRRILGFFPVIFVCIFLILHVRWQT